MSDYWEKRAGKLDERLAETLRKCGSAEMELAMTLQRLADAWDKIGRPDGARDARERAKKILASFTRAA